MRSTVLTGVITALALLLIGSSSVAQSQSDVYWRIDPSVKSCSMVIDPTLTQSQWHTFVQQAGVLSSFKSLSSAQTLGTMNFLVAIDYASTPVDQHDEAWINTFTHPNKDCPLGDAVVMPTLRARMGVTDDIDVGGFWITSLDANYGLVGGEVKYAFLQESEARPAMAVRGSATILTGVPDFDLNIYSVDVLASKRISEFAPYIGVRTNLIVGTETTSKVNLTKEVIPVVQGYAGVVFSLWVIDLAAEYNISAVNTFALSVGVGF